MCGGGVSRDRDGGGGQVEPCLDEYLLPLRDWNQAYPSVNQVPVNVIVELQQTPNDRTTSVYLNGVKIGHIFALGLATCLDKHDYTAVLVRHNSAPYVRASRNP